MRRRVLNRAQESWRKLRCLRRRDHKTFCLHARFGVHACVLRRIEQLKAHAGVRAAVDAAALAPYRPEPVA